MGSRKKHSCRQQRSPAVVVLASSDSDSVGLRNSDLEAVSELDMWAWEGLRLVRWLRWIRSWLGLSCCVSGGRRSVSIPGDGCASLAVSLGK